MAIPSATGEAATTTPPIYPTITDNSAHTATMKIATPTAPPHAAARLSTDRLYIEVYARPKKFKALLDPGATSSFIQHHLFESIQPRLPPMATDKHFRSATGDMLDIAGVADINVRMDDGNMSIPFYVGRNLHGGCIWNN